MNWVILASGPSMSPDQCELVRQWKEAGNGRVLAINTTHRLAPWADVLYACDGTWWDHHYREVKRTFRGELWTQDARTARSYPEIKPIRCDYGVGLCRDPKAVHHGGGKQGSGNGGYQAVNLAFHFGAKRIILLGFDMKTDGQRKNWHERHVLNVSSPYEMWVRNFKPLAIDLESLGIELVNATPDSALTCIRKVSLTEALDARVVLAA